MATKKVKTIVKLNLPAGEATPAPPLGPILGQHGVAIMDFVKQYNDRTAQMRGNVVPAVITIYEDRSFDFITKLAPVSDMIKKKLGVQKGSGDVPRKIVGTLKKSDIIEIAKEKLPDLNANTIEAATKTVEGTARSMGVKVEK